MDSDVLAQNSLVQSGSPGLQSEPTLPTPRAYHLSPGQDVLPAAEAKLLRSPQCSRPLYGPQGPCSRRQVRPPVSRPTTSRRHSIPTIWFSVHLAAHLTDKPGCKSARSSVPTSFVSTRRRISTKQHLLHPRRLLPPRSGNASAPILLDIHRAPSTRPSVRSALTSLVVPDSIFQQASLATRLQKHLWHHQPTRADSIFSQHVPKASFAAESATSSESHIILPIKSTRHHGRAAHDR